MLQTTGEYRFKDYVDLHEVASTLTCPTETRFDKETGEWVLKELSLPSFSQTRMEIASNNPAERRAIFETVEDLKLFRRDNPCLIGKEGYDGAVWYFDIEEYRSPPMGSSSTDSKFSLKDSGKREEFATGSRRDTREGKGRFDLISPIALKRLAQVYEKGAIKYGDRNWEKGQPLRRYLDSAARHLNDWLGGDRSEDHLMQCAWNCFAYVHTEELIKQGKLPQELNDVG